MSKIVAVFALLVIVLYGGFKVFPLLSGPELSLTSPADGQVFRAHTLVITGISLHTETLLLNGATLPIDAEGRFSKTLTLPSGGAILSLTASDRFGKKKTVERSVFITD